jgi:transmembrane sensor
MQHRDKYKKIEDFLEDDSFQRWVRFGEDHSNWKYWTLESSERARLVEEARIWVLAMKVSEESIPFHEVQEALQNTWHQIHTKILPAPFNAFWKNNWFRAAAAVFLISAGALSYSKFFYPQKESKINYAELIKQESDGLIEQINNSDKPKLITLADASSVLLEPESKLSYPKKFSEHDRKVYLSGEGFFEISKNQKKPFFVYANEVVTQVYGTSFRVKAFENQANVEVYVHTGIVKVSSNKVIKSGTKEEVTLLPNQAARFFRRELKFEKINDITQDTPIQESKGTIENLSFEFNDVPVARIFKTVEQAYDVQINFPVELLKSCYLTTSLKDEPLPEKLKIICESLGNNSRFEMNGDQIIIISKGCN